MAFRRLAQLIARDSDHETYIFRSFDEIGIRTLLQLQSELAQLEREQQRMDEAVIGFTSNRHVQLLQSRWGQLDDLDEQARRCPEVERRVELANKIAEKLERYYKLLALQKQVAAYDRPSDRVMQAYRSVFYGRDGKTAELYEPLQSKALSSDDNDYVALHPPKERDLLSKFLRDHLPARATNLYSHGSRHVKQYETRWVARLATFGSILIATILLIASILLLYNVQAPNARLGLVLTFIVLFAIGVSISTAATRDSIFAATAAYSAVLIVFVSGNLGAATGTDGPGG